MKITKAVKPISASLISLAIAGAVSAAPNQYGMSLQQELVTTDNGAITARPQAAVNTAWNVAEKQVDQISEGVYRIAGWGIGNIIALEGPKGWIIIDTGDNIQYASEQRAALERKVGQSIKVAGILYTHSHYVHGTEVWRDENTQIFGHEELTTNLRADEGINILSGNFKTRAAIQFGMLHPLEGKDAFPSVLGFSPEKLSGESGFIPPDITFKDGAIETYSIAGLEVEVLPSQTDVLDSVAFYFPQHKLLVSNAMNDDSLFNLYTLRGDIYRDPMRLVNAADLALSRDIELHIDIHGAANIGKDKARQALEYFRDSMQLIHDQTYRGIAMGKDAQEIAEWIYMPKRLRANQETYGQVESYAKQVYNARIGWMGWDVYEINPLPKQLQAQKTVEAMGGVDAVISMAQQAQAKGDINSTQWSLFLTTQLQNMGALTELAKQIRADSARTLGQHTSSANARGFYISEALLQEGSLRFGKHTITDYQQLSDSFAALDAQKLASSPLDDNVHYLRYMLDTRLAEDKALQFNLHFVDEDAHYAIALRNGVIAITQQANKGKTFELTKQKWDQMLLGELTFSQLDKELKLVDQVIGR
ncbi:alkyl sulfatase dimerization domain-containing protein [Agarivorans aestuarii]|uniref:alkyl sulfatase dimerization domain-containing protein n=1 Tax=Agarivorans aestuarii TaxID=1563703 RepID=UPI001C7ECA0B|nr:alkyl sulfatase dimerization domain-containing protein [Agarivorans aestuarii]